MATFKITALVSFSIEFSTTTSSVPVMFNFSSNAVLFCEIVIEANK